MDRLLGTPPDQILESEKLCRLQDIADRHVAILNRPKTTVAEIEQWSNDLIAIHEEERELDRKYPGLP